MNPILATVDPIRLTGNRVLVLPKLDPPVSDSGVLHLPSSARRRTRALVIAVAPTAARRTPELTPGVEVVCIPDTGFKVNFSGYPMRLINHAEVLGILEAAT